MTRRRAPSRRRMRRSGRRQGQADEQLLMVLGAGVTVIGLVVTVVNWLLAHWWVLITVVMLAALAGAGWVYQRRQRARWAQVQARGLRYALGQLDALHHR
ncbi:restriction endonuclease, partial [Streptomyces sp. NPDC058656]